jgi:hypothetical protein
LEKYPAGHSKQSASTDRVVPALIPQLKLPKRNCMEIPSLSSLNFDSLHLQIVHGPTIPALP